MDLRWPYSYIIYQELEVYFFDWLFWVNVGETKKNKAI